MFICLLTKFSARANPIGFKLRRYGDLGIFLAFRYAPPHQKKTHGVAWEWVCMGQKISDAFATNNSSQWLFGLLCAHCTSLTVGPAPRVHLVDVGRNTRSPQKVCMSSIKCCYFSACEGWAWKHTKCKMEGFYQMYVPCTTYNYLRWTVCVLSQQYDFMQVTISHALKSVFFSREGYACMKYNGCKLQTIYTQSKVSIKVFWLLMQESLWQ